MFLIFLPLLFLPAFADEYLDAIKIIHHSTPSTLVDFVPSAVNLKKNELRKRRESTLGDTLKNEAGVQSTSFGPNASRPIIRGLDGDRIRVLQNGLGVLDASSQSADHAVPVDTLVIDSVEVVRGPTSMLYGSSAVGGVVNIVTNRIHSTFEEGSLQEIQVQGDSSQDALSTAAKIDYGANKWMFHFDGGYRNANDLKVPKADKKERVSDPGEIMNVEKLANTGSVQKSAALGVSKIFDNGFLGMSYNFYDNFYGSVAEPSVDIKMKQNRLELNGEYLVKGDLLKTIQLKTAQSDYSHKEFESGLVGTTFSNEGNETRLEFLTEASNIKGVSGLQTQIFNFKAVGDEAFLPPSRNQILSAFTLQELAVGSSFYSFGTRIEAANIDNQTSGEKEKNFTGLNGSLGLRHQFSETHTGLATFSYTERLPNFQELYADGFHVAAGTFEQGDENLKKEKAFSLDMQLKYKSDSVETSFSIYGQKFKDYISLFFTDTPSSEPGVNVSEFKQVDAIFYGAEFEGKKRLGDSPYHLVTRADIVRAKDQDSGKDLPRISPPRLALGLEMAKDRWVWDVEAQHSFEQTKTADNETNTDAFTLLNAGMNYDLVKNNGKWSFFGRFKNIFNQVARLHTSTVKDIAPLAGRNVVAGVQYSF